MSAEQFFWGLAIIAVLAVVGWLALEAVHAPTEVEPTPLDDLMDGPAEQVGDDTLDMVAEDNDGWSPCPCSDGVTHDWADLTDGIVYGPEVLRRIREGLREQVIEHVAFDAAEGIDDEWADLAMRPAAEWPTKGAEA